MNFKKTTDALFARIDHTDLAKAIGVSVPLIRQARLSPNAKAHRSPPDGWERAALRLAENQAKHYLRLADRIRRDVNHNDGKQPG